MKAFVVDEPGEPDVLRLRDVPTPQPGSRQALIAVKAFGLNRAEAVTRAGGSGKAVRFPRVIGIECVGEILESPGGQFQKGQTVATLMGGLGRKFDGSYAEMTVAPVKQIIPLETSLSWPELAAIPETFLTAWGCLFNVLKIKEGARIVMRPGASALGLAVTQIVNDLGGQVIGITRSAHKAEQLRAAGMHKIIVSADNVADQVLAIWPEGATGIIDTITSGATINDDLKMKARRGRLCVAGSLAASSGQNPGLGVAAALARPGVATFSSEVIDSSWRDTLQMIVNRVEAKRYRTNVFKTFAFEDVSKAHELIEANGASGKLVVIVSV